ncbi:response regulator [Candidatus Saccharibacteria bacterium]|nr:response regulator [Candidatus Saccharibacteria bacterium]MDQ5885142.1 two-component system, OmpR family, response regulator [Patescibacteria group bacterium]MDQ5953721.1 two-component system, OmpR family, response regulator [Patescibacteria group bacterium]MDQ5958682.1 two-component system, OmpR family, response regulator [Patescibacteria group bacterium]
MKPSKKILIAEDEKPLAHAMELKLSNAGYVVTVANDGDQAIQYLKNNKYDLLLLDLIMPVSDGFNVLQNMKISKNKTPVIVMSNLSQEEDKIKTTNFGVKDFFIKSDTSLAELILKIQTYI